VRVTNPPGNGIGLWPPCTGTIDRIEVSGVRNGDGIKVHDPGQGDVHDLVIGGGFVRCAGSSTNGTHQDGIQAMGGVNILMRNLVFDCYGGGGGNYFIKNAVGPRLPTDVVCDHCAFGPRHPNVVRIESSIRSGMRNTLICRSQSRRQPVVILSEAQSPVNTGNIEAPLGDPRCTLDGLLAYAGS
jgi:hypothetical protein